VTFVVFEWDGITRSLEEEDSVAVVAALRSKALRPAAANLADKIEMQARGGTFAQPAQNVRLGVEEQRELREALDRLDEQSSMNHARQTLRTALSGERRPGEPGYPA
jgi:hypothetical protein